MSKSSSLANNSPSDLWVLSWYTPLEGIKGKIFTLTCDGVDLPYQGRMVKRAMPEKNDYILIRSGQTVSATVDLATVFHIPDSGTCTLSFKGTLHDLATSEQDVPRDPERHEAISMKGAALTFRLERRPAR
jgi:peptidyl-Lys metalloendopeptidase